MKKEVEQSATPWPLLLLPQLLLGHCRKQLQCSWGLLPGDEGLEMFQFPANLTADAEQEEEEGAISATITSYAPSLVTLSEGPHSVHKPGSPSLPPSFFEYTATHHITVLGICYGLRLIVKILGGHVKPAVSQEYGCMDVLPLSGSMFFGDGSLPSAAPKASAEDEFSSESDEEDDTMEVDTKKPINPSHPQKVQTFDSDVESEYETESSSETESLTQEPDVVEGTLTNAYMEAPPPSQEKLQETQVLESKATSEEGTQQGTSKAAKQPEKDPPPLRSAKGELRLALCKDVNMMLMDFQDCFLHIPLPHADSSPQIGRISRVLLEGNKPPSEKTNQFEQRRRPKKEFLQLCCRGAQSSSLAGHEAVPQS